MWSVFHDTGMFMITTNPKEKNDGSIVMGRGIALEAKQRFPTIPHDFGRKLRNADFRNIGMIGEYDGTPIWWFMVKDHWARPARLDIIADSSDMLNRFIRRDIRVDLNFPGIGNGKLNREDVLPLLEDLPDNIHIWEKE